MNIILIESVEAEGTEWGLSFTDTNPKPKDYLKMPDKETAINTKKILSRLLGIGKKGKYDKLPTMWVNRNYNTYLQVNCFDEDHQLSFVINRYNNPTAYSLDVEEAEDLIEFLKAHVANEKLNP